jgi:hypothetical protein
VDKGRQGGQLLRLYVDDRYVLLLTATRNGRGYSVSGIHPLRFDDHDKIAGGVLLPLRAWAWRFYEHPSAIPALLGKGCSRVGLTSAGCSPRVGGSDSLPLGWRR